MFCGSTTANPTKIGVQRILILKLQYIYVFKCPSENHDMNYSYTLNMSKDSKHCNKQEHYIQFGNPVTVTLCVKLFQHVIRIECVKKYISKLSKSTCIGDHNSRAVPG